MNASTARDTDRGRLSLDGVEHVVLDHGPRDAPTTVVLVHGWGSNAAAWAQHLPSLAQEHRVLALDLRGHGGTPPGPDAVTWSRTASDLALLARSAGLSGRRILVGHSMGGTIATAAAMSGDWDGLVVVDPAYGADEQEVRGVPDRISRLRVEGGAAAVPGLPHAFTTGVCPGLLVAAEHALLTASPRALVELVESAYLGPDAVAPTTQARRWLRGRRLPTLALYPDDERARTDRAVGGADVEVWRGASHFLHQEDPLRFVDTVMRWLREAVV